MILTKAVAACEGLYRSFPETHRTQLEMDIRAEIEDDIYRKLEPMSIVEGSDGSGREPRYYANLHYYGKTNECNLDVIHNGL
ncbi:hypothetical protein ABER23_21785 [Paenibacillus lautus]|uniref:hypothetical protein n=1 Tax=Paenibacillus lautus TaxID=1401 RepID=UPI003D2913D5